MDSITISRSHINYQENKRFTFVGTITEGKSYRINDSDDYTFEGKVYSIFPDPDGDEIVELITPGGNSEFIGARGIYSFEEI